MIPDNSFFGVNDNTIPLAPPEAMQFGQTFKRLLQRIYRTNDVFGPVYSSKTNLSDGFYWLRLRTEDTFKLAVLFLSCPGEAPLVGIPLTNPMGWCLSPLNFSTCTETVADLANASLENLSEQATTRMTSHRLDTISKTNPSDIPPITMAHVLSIPCITPFKKPLWYWDIYMDDFCGLVQGSQWTHKWVKHILLRSLDQVFRPLDDDNTAFCQESASIKKMKQGDAT